MADGGAEAAVPVQPRRKKAARFSDEPASSPLPPSVRWDTTNSSTSHSVDSVTVSSSTSEKGLGVDAALSSAPRFRVAQTVTIDPPRHSEHARLRGKQAVVVSSQSADGQSGLGSDAGATAASQWVYTVQVDGVEVSGCNEGWLQPRNTLATSNHCEFVCLKELFRLGRVQGGGFRVPLFQRRYCWGEPQWTGLWAAVTALAEQPHRTEHSLKRVLTWRRPHDSTTATAQPSEHAAVLVAPAAASRMEQGGLGVEEPATAEAVPPSAPLGELVLDGQQRLTTCCILLAALRDALAAVDSQPLDDGAAAALERAVAETITLPNTPGGAPCVYVLQPTLDDRADFGVAMSQKSPPSFEPAPSDDAGLHVPPLIACRRFFDAQLAGMAASAVGAAASVVLEKLKVTYFPVEGAVQMQAIYERAAMSASVRDGARLFNARLHVQDEMEAAGEGDATSLTDAEVLERYGAYEAGLKSQVKGVAETGMDMSPIDLIRNYVLEHFVTEDEQRRVYAELWLPMERRCSTAHSALSTAEACEAVFSAALAILGSPLINQESSTSRAEGAATSAAENSADAMAGLFRATQARAKARLQVYTVFAQWWEESGATAHPDYKDRLAAFDSVTAAAL